VAVVDDYGFAERWCIGREVLIDPGMGGLSDGIKQKEGTVILTAKVRPIFRGRRAARSDKRIVMRRHQTSCLEKMTSKLGKD